MKTSVPKLDAVKADTNWYVVDATDQTLGRLAAVIAPMLRGKNKPTFTPHMDMGDHVVVINADKIRVTGSKMAQKFYYSHSGHPGHLKYRNLEEMLTKKPMKVLEKAIYGMLPKNKLRDRSIQRLHLYEGAEHKHEAQNPQPLSI